MERMRRDISFFVLGAHTSSPLSGTKPVPLARASRRSCLWCALTATTSLWRVALFICTFFRIERGVGHYNEKDVSGSS